MEMKKVSINVPDDKYQFFMELVQTLGFEEVDKTEAQKDEVLNGIEQGLKEVKLIQEGKMKGTSLKDFLNEL